MNKKKEQDLEVMAKKLYNQIQNTLPYFELGAIDESKVLEILVKMLQADFINYD